MPKWTCFSYPAGVSSFEITFEVGPNEPSSSGYTYGRNVYFGAVPELKCEPCPGCIKLTFIETFVGRKNDIETPESTKVGRETVVAEGLQTVADFNRDGFMDILSEKAICFGDGTGDFTESERYPYITLNGETPRTVTTMDYDNDGDVDLVVVEGTEGDATDRYIVVNPGNGEMEDAYTVQLVGLEQNLKTEVITPVDINKDGLEDLLLGHEDGDMEVWMNPGATSISTFKIPGTTGVTDIVVADIDKDGVEDIIFIDETGIKYLSSPAGSEVTREAAQIAILTQEIRQLAGVSSATELEVADVDADGEMDLIVGTGSEGGWTLAIYFGPLAPSSAMTRVTVDASLSQLAVKDLEVADVNRDGWLDVAAAFERTTTGPYYRRIYYGSNALSETRSGWESLEGSKIGADVEDTLEVEAMDLADLDGDGSLDLIYSTAESTSVVLGEDVESTFDATSVANQKRRMRNLEFKDGGVLQNVEVEVGPRRSTAGPQPECSSQAYDGNPDDTIGCPWHDSSLPWEPGDPHANTYTTRTSPDVDDCRFPGDDYYTVTTTLTIDFPVVPCVGKPNPDLECILLDPIKLVDESVDNSGGAANRLCYPEAPPPPPPPVCPNCDGEIEKTIYAIVHGYSDSTFWKEWGVGARAALDECTIKFVYLTTDYNIATTVDYINDACAKADGAIVTVPYAEDARAPIADAINACTSAKPSFRFELSNTDTAYDMGGETSTEPPVLEKSWAGYAGSFNFIMGDICGRYLVNGSLDIAVAGEPISLSSYERAAPVEIYLAERELANQGILQRSEGIIKAIGSEVPVYNSPDDLNSANRIVALGTGAYDDLVKEGITPAFQCGDDHDMGKVQFFGQTVYTQGLQAAAQLYAELVRPDFTAGITGSTSGAEAGEILKHEYAQASYGPLPECLLHLTVITHGAESSDFWQRWKQGSEVGAQNFVWTYVTSQYDGDMHAAAVTEACDAQEPSQDAIVVTVPFNPGSTEYKLVDDAIIACMEKRPTLPIVTTNTDTYHNPKAVSYVGSDNYAMGKVCAFAGFSDDDKVLRGSIDPTADIPDSLRDSVRVVVYQLKSEMENEGINSRYAGISETVGLIRAANPAKRYYSVGQVAEACPEGDTTCFVIALGIGALTELRSAVSVDFACGDNMDPEINHYGQHVWSQGVGASTQAITAARRAWPAIIGNAVQIGDPISLKVEGECYPEGLVCDFDADYENDINNLGGFPGPGKKVHRGEDRNNPECSNQLAYGETPPQSGCKCGCGCGCSDTPYDSLADHQDELRFAKVGRIYNGSGAAAIQTLDLVVTNSTKYTAWNSMGNGRKAGQSFGEISMAADTSTTFVFAFEDSVTGGSVEVQYPFDFCVFDIDKGIDGGIGGVLKETAVACETEGYYHQGKPPENNPSMAPSFCDTIDVSKYLEIAETPDGCVTATALAEGTGRDNPQHLEDVLMDPSGAGSCAAYDQCPVGDKSGFPRGPLGADGVGRIQDIKYCQDSSEATGLYSDSPKVTERLRGTPLRYTIPKYICYSYPAGTSSFEITYTVGPNAASAAPFYGRNFLFACAKPVVNACPTPSVAAPVPARIAQGCRPGDNPSCVLITFQARMKECSQHFSSTTCTKMEAQTGGTKCTASCAIGGDVRRRLSRGTPMFNIAVTLQAPSVGLVEVVEAKLVAVMSNPEAASAFLAIEVISIPVLVPEYTHAKEDIGLVVGCVVGGALAVALVIVGVVWRVRKAGVSIREAPSPSVAEKAPHADAVEAALE